MTSTSHETSLGRLAALAFFAVVGSWQAAGSIAMAADADSVAVAVADSRQGTGRLSILYQFNTTDGFESSIGKLPIGIIDTRVLNFELEYFLTDRLMVTVGLPYASKRYDGTFPHDPLTLDPPRPQVENVDLGDWNSGFQDFYLGAKYLLKDDRFSVAPFANLGVPSHEYPFFGNAAIGQQLTRLELGTSLLWYPGLSDAYYSADIGYVFVEKTLGVSVNYLNLLLEAGYRFSEKVTGKVFGRLKKGSGLTVPEGFPGFPTDLTDENWYQHDRTLKHNFANVGAGIDWIINDRYIVSANYMTMVWEDQVNILDYAVTFSVSRSF